MLPEDLREDEPKFGHVSRHRRTHHGRLMRVHSKLPCRHLVRRSWRSERALAPREIASAFGRKEHLVASTRYHETTQCSRLLAMFQVCGPDLLTRVGYLPPIE